MSVLRLKGLLLLGTAAVVAIAAATAFGAPFRAHANTTLVIDGSVAPITADPGHMRDVAGRTLMHAMYQTLLGFTSESVSKPQPLLAKSYTLSPDNMTLTLQLRTGIRFSDGTPLTADDVLFSLNRVKYLLGQPAFLLKGITITSPKANTIVLKSDTPEPELPFVVTDPALGILNSKVVKANGGLDTPNAATADKAQAYLGANSAGSGPYVLKSFSISTETVMTKNPYYSGPGPKPAYAQIVYRLTPPSSQQIEVQNGTAQISLDLSASQASPLRSKLNVALHPAGSTWFLLMNNSPKISSVTPNKYFQAAVRAGIDYNKVIKVAGAGNSREASISPQTLAYALPLKYAPKYNLAKAKQLLAKSGLSHPTVTFEYPDPYSSSGVPYANIAQVIQASLAKVGITANLKPTSVPVAITNYVAGTEEFSLWSYSVSPPDPISGIIRQFGPGNKFGLRAGWPTGADPGLATIVNKIVASSSVAERTNLIQKFYTGLNSSAPFIPLFSASQVVVSSKSVGNIVYNPQWTIDFAAMKPVS
jgi:peptide/nickel transport system substrate-binding protein